MKATIRVPMRESFAYIEFEVEGTIEQAFEVYKHAQAQMPKATKDNW